MTEDKKSAVTKISLEKINERNFCPSLERQKDLVYDFCRNAKMVLLEMKNNGEALDEFSQKITVAINPILRLLTKNFKTLKNRSSMK